MRAIILLVTIAVYCLSFPGKSNADCDPATFLKYEDIKSKQDIALQLSYLNTLSKTDADKIDTGGGFTYEGIPFTGHATRDVASALNTKLKIDFSDIEKYWYTESKLSVTGKEAYIKCLENLTDNFRIAVVGDAMAAEEFIVDIKSTPKKDLPKNQPISVRVIGGKLLATDPVLTAFEQAEAHISRDLDKQTIVSIRVGKDIQRIVLPPRPNTFNIEIRKSRVAERDAYGGQNNPIEDLCVELPNSEQDATMIPGTLTLHKNPIEEVRGSIIISGKPQESSRNSCATVMWHLATDEGRVRGPAWLEANVAKVAHPASK
jgi:hypothetical protein